MGRRYPRTAGLMLVAAATALVGTALHPVTPPGWSGARVPAVLQTAPAYGEGDTADDPAIWIHPDDPALSLVIGTNKKDPGGLQVFDLQGQERQFVRSGRLNNVDLREGFPFEDGPGTVIAASSRSEDTVEFFRVDPERRRLDPVGSVPTRMREVYGLCLYRSPRTDRFHAIVTSEAGPVRQYELGLRGGAITMDEVRRWEFVSQAEGCVADDEHAQLFVTQEARGLWKLGAEPDVEPELVLLSEASIEASTEAAPLTPDVEGVTIYDAGDGTGYLVVSSQGASTFAVYDRQAPHRHLGSFAVDEGDVSDGASNTDGVAVSAVPVDDRFPAGLLVVHDQHNRGASTSNFKYVSWHDVVRVLGLGSVGGR
jgi:3-phytase